MDEFSALLALCAGKSPVTGEFPVQRPVTRSFNVSFDLRLNKWLRKQSWGWWFETPPFSLWRHRNGMTNISRLDLNVNYWSTFLLMDYNWLINKPLWYYHQFSCSLFPWFFIDGLMWMMLHHKSLISLKPSDVCFSKVTIIGSDKGFRCQMSPSRRQAIIWTNPGILLIGSLGKNFSEILINIIKIHILSFKKLQLKMSSGNW